MKSKILIVLLLLAVILSVSAVSASEANETVQTMADDSQQEAVLESSYTVNEEDVLKASSDNGSDVVVLKAADENASEPVLARVVSADLNETVTVNGSVKDVKSVSGEPVLKSSYGKIKKLTFNSKYNKYVTKKVGKYKVQVYKWKGYRLGGLRIYLIKNSKYVKRTSFATRAYFKMDGRWKWSPWSHASSGFPSYHHYDVSSNVKITKVQVKFRYR